MKFQEPVRQAEFLKRYKRFFADVRHQDEVVVAHVPNTGSLKTCLFEGAPCVITESADPKRKLKATLHFIQTPSGWVGVNTALPNLLAHEAWQHGRIESWRAFKAAQLEFKISKETRLDLVLAPDQAALAEKKNLHFVEIKNATYAEDGVAYFPDAVTTRGQKHLIELMNLKKQGSGAELLFVVQRENCETFRPADHIDPDYGRLLREAKKQGVVVRALACDIEPFAGVHLSTRELDIQL